MPPSLQGCESPAGTRALKWGVQVEKVVGGGGGGHGEGKIVGFY